MALTADIKVDEYGVPEGNQLLVQPLGSNVTVYGGSICLTDSSGNVKNASTPASTDTCWGLVHAQVPGLQGATSSVAGTYQVTIQTGTFLLANGTSTDTITQSLVGTTCYVIDEQTVGATNGGSSRPVAGRVFAVNPDGTGRIAVKMGNAQSTGSP